MLNASSCIYTLLLFARNSNVVLKQDLIFLSVHWVTTFCKGDWPPEECCCALCTKLRQQVTDTTFYSTFPSEHFTEIFCTDFLGLFWFVSGLVFFFFGGGQGEGRIEEDTKGSKCFCKDIYRLSQKKNLQAINAKPQSLQELETSHGKYHRLLTSLFCRQLLITVLFSLDRLCKVIRKLKWLLHPVTNLSESISLKDFLRQGGKS